MIDAIENARNGKLKRCKLSHETSEISHKIAIKTTIFRDISLLIATPVRMLFRTWNRRLDERATSIQHTTALLACFQITANYEIVCTLQIDDYFSPTRASLEQLRFRKTFPMRMSLLAR